MFDNEIDALTDGISGIEINRNDLPISKYRDYIIETVQKNQIVIVFGDTGSGKTTQIPQYLYEAGLNNGKVIGVTQPRRIAAINMANRVSQEMKVVLGETVGYEIRFDRKSSPETKIKFMTDGILLTYCVTDCKLSEYSIIMIDEAHERTVDTDVLLGLLKMIAKQREDLKILITSATIKTEKFSKYFDSAPIVSFEGRMFHVDIIYEPMVFLSAIFVSAMVRKIDSNPDKGDILVFLTGQDMIEECCDMLENVPSLVVLPLFSALDYASQQQIFKPVEANKRKVIVATNIAETSITVDGIRFVIDCGYVKQNYFNVKTGIEVLKNVRISQAQSDQRKGRAGRTSTGFCYRLYDESTFDKFEKVTTPEIYRKNLSGVYLKLVAMGLDPMNFDFIDAPNRETLENCLLELQDLELLDSMKQITSLGRKMDDFPVEPKIGKALLISLEHSCSLDVVTILAMLTEKNLFIRTKKLRRRSDIMKKQFHHPDGDHFMFLEIYRKWESYGKSKEFCFRYFLNFKTMQRIELIRSQLMCLMQRKSMPLESISPGSDIDCIKKALISGFYKNICHGLIGGTFVNYYNKSELVIHPSSCLVRTMPQLILYYEVVETSQPFMRGIMTFSHSILTGFPREMKQIEYKKDVSILD